MNHLFVQRHLLKPKQLYLREVPATNLVHPIDLRRLVLISLCGLLGFLSPMFFYSRPLPLQHPGPGRRAGPVGRTGGHALALLERCRIERYRIIYKKLTCSKPTVHKVVPTNNQGRTTSPHLEPAPMLTRIYRLWEDAGFPFCSRSFDRVVIIDQWYVLRFETRETRFRTPAIRVSGLAVT